MRFDEQGGTANRNRSACQWRHHTPITARGIAITTGLLHRMGRIKYDRIASLGHRRQTTEIADECVVAERRATLAEHDVGVARALNLSGDVLHIPRRKELPLLHVDRLARLTRSQQKVCLTAKECWDLQDIDELSRHPAMVRLVHVGDHRAAELFANFRKDRQPRLCANPALSTQRRTVGLVIRPLKHEPRARRRTSLSNFFRQHTCMIKALELARPRNQRKRQIIGNFYISDCNAMHGALLGST